MHLHEIPEALRAAAAEAETAGLNASAPPQQELLDGWLIRLSPGKAKRSRCINAIAQGQRPLQDMLASCQRAFAKAGLPLVVRITPFTQPADLDDQLGALGWARFDATQVMLLPDLAPLVEAALPGDCTLQHSTPQDYAQAVGQLRGSSAEAIEAHAQRLLASPVAYVGLLLKRREELLACGQFAREGAAVGLYDIFTVPAHRGQGLARGLCTQLLLQARAAGAQRAYLQVSDDNLAARSIYRGLGFIDGYSYHYRTPDLAQVY
jgi:GNAT superfamily N-acetyltransferase